jgi:sirohydrochlorin cobaltochelatase
VHGLILFAHGARDPAWALPLEASAERAQTLLPNWEVRLAFLEFLSPDLAHCGASLVAVGCTTIVVFPLFLGAGGHVRRDLPAQVEALRVQFPGVRWVLRPAAGESGQLIEAMAQAAAESGLTALAADLQ